VIAECLVAVLCAAAGPAQPALPEGRHVRLGSSTEGRAIRAVRLGDPASPRKALVVGAIHGNETAGVRVTRALRRRAGVAGVDLWVVDSVNPDGAARGRRQNARGVDLNRNFPRRWRRGSRGSPYYSGSRALSERESRVVARWIERLRPAATIWYHQPWGMVLTPCSGEARLERSYARLTGMRTGCRGAGLRGTATSWQEHRFPGSSAFVVELPGGGVSAKAARVHARAAALVAALP
jgi:murein peptide amidase A